MARMYALCVGIQVWQLYLYPNFGYLRPYLQLPMNLQVGPESQEKLAGLLP